MTTKAKKKTAPGGAVQYDYKDAFIPGYASVMTAAAAVTTTAGTSWAGGADWFPAAAGAGLAAAAGLHAHTQWKDGDVWRVSRVMAGTAALWGAEGSAALVLDPGTWGTTGWLSAAAVGAATWLVTFLKMRTADRRDEAHMEAIASGTTLAQQVEVDRKLRPIVDRWTPYMEAAGMKGLIGIAAGETPLGWRLEFISQETNPSEFEKGSYGENVAFKAGLVKGQSVSFSVGERKDVLVMDVRLKDPMEVGGTFPDDFSTLSINGDLPLFMDRAAAPVVACLRDKNTMIVAPTRTGKTTLLDAFITAFLRCKDVQVWGINTGKRGAFDRWSPADGTGMKHAAYSVAEAHALLDAAEAVHHHRNDTEASGEMEMSAERPHIVIVLDEAVALSQQAGGSDLLSRVAVLSGLSASSGVTFVVTSVRWQLDAMESSMLRENCSVKIAMVRTADGRNTAHRMGITVNTAGMNVVGDLAAMLGSPDEQYTGRSWSTKPAGLMGKEADAADADFSAKVIAETKYRRPELEDGAAAAAAEFLKLVPTGVRERSNVAEFPVPHEAKERLQPAGAGAASDDMWGFLGDRETSV